MPARTQARIAIRGRSRYFSSLPPGRQRAAREVPITAGLCPEQNQHVRKAQQHQNANPATVPWRCAIRNANHSARLPANTAGRRYSHRLGHAAPMHTAPACSECDCCRWASRRSARPIQSLTRSATTRSHPEPGRPRGCQPQGHCRGSQHDRKCHRCPLRRCRNITHLRLNRRFLDAYRRIFGTAHFRFSYRNEPAVSSRCPATPLFNCRVAD